MSIQSPCHGCGKRTATCHSGCEDYKAYRDQMNERSRTIFEASLPDKSLNRYNVIDNDKSLKKWRKKK